MKAIKISVALVVVTIICILIGLWYVKTDDVGKIKPPTNQFTARIESEIDSLSKASENVFCNKFFEKIQNDITDFHKTKEFDSIEKNNDQWQEIFSKNLFSAYAPKFSEQAFYVFKGSEWKIADLNFIRSEVKSLQRSTYLESGSNIDKKFGEIHTILSKYDEIANFISSCNNFSYSNYELNSTFPINDISNKIQSSKTYLSNGLDNSYVNNCTRLKDGLQEIPQSLFNKHSSYLRLKIQHNSDRYKDYNYQSDYSNTIYTPLKKEIEALNNEIYGVPENNFDNNKNSLENLLGSDNRNANNYFRNKK